MPVSKFYLILVHFLAKSQKKKCQKKKSSVKQTKRCAPNYSYA